MTVHLVHQLADSHTGPVPLDGAPDLTGLDPRRLLTTEETARRLSIGRTLVYRLMASGDLESVRIGRLRRIPAVALDDDVDRLRLASTEQGHQ